MRSQTFLEQAIDLTHSLQLPRLRTKLLEGIEIPLLSLEQQREVVAHLDAMNSKAQVLTKLQKRTSQELDALLPSILGKAFKGDL